MRLRKRHSSNIVTGWRMQVETHDGIRRVDASGALYACKSLRRINLKSAVEIENYTFYRCENLETVEFGDRLE
eukprot:scaffold3919_cov227-Skeletonema_menzelii.AAC.4